MSIVTQQVCDPNEIPFPLFCLVRRRGLWEQHAESITPSVRVLDDFLAGGQNETVGYQYTHRLATLDSVSGTLRVLGETVGCNLMMFCSDLSKTFKQILAVDSLQKNSVVVQWDLVRAMPASMTALTQTFG